MLLLLLVLENANVSPSGRLEQNDYGRIGSLFRRASPLIEHETSELVRQVFGENLFTIFSRLLTQSFFEI